MTVDLDGLSVDNLRALAKCGPPKSRNAARALLKGERPTAHECNSLIEYVTRDSRSRGKSTNDKHRDA